AFRILAATSVWWRAAANASDPPHRAKSESRLLELSALSNSSWQDRGMVRRIDFLRLMRHPGAEGAERLASESISRSRISGRRLRDRVPGTAGSCLDSVQQSSCPDELTAQDD